MNEALGTQIGGEHYLKMGIQTMEFCFANMTDEELRGVLKFNVTKYIWRSKGDDLEDYAKAKHYIEMIRTELRSRRPECPS